MAEAPPGDGGGRTYRVRLAEEGDLDVLAAFEVDIARISFREDAVVDPEAHRKKLVKALARDRQGMMVAVDESGRVVGWLWISINQNLLTGATYANFRSLATSAAGRGIGEILMEHGLRYVQRTGAGEVVGRVYLGNTPMRTLYRRFGFEPAHLTMRRKLPRSESLGNLPSR